MRMSPNATPRSTQETSTMARLAVGALSKGTIGLGLRREKRPHPRVGRVPEHVRGVPTGYDAPALQHDGSITAAACFGQAMRDHHDGQALLSAQAARRFH